MAYDNKNLQRPYWGGLGQDVDIHIEEHTGIVDTQFAYTSKMAPLAGIRTLRNTNQLRIDRLGAATVSGRRVGEELVSTATKQEKFSLAVDTVIYNRREVDYFDEWTANSDMRREYAEAAGTALAQQFDQAVLIAAAKAPDFVPPASLAGAFYPGVMSTAAVTKGADAQLEVSEENAIAIVRAHRQSLEVLIERNMGDSVYGGGGVSIVTPRVFSCLLEHSKLVNVQFGEQDRDGNNFHRGRIAILNGVRVMEMALLPHAPITSNPLGDAFLVSEAEARRQIVTIADPKLALITAQVHALSAKVWEDQRNWSTVIDTFQSYNIGLRRPDAVAVVQLGDGA